jgi:hypothetical protein
MRVLGFWRRTTLRLCCSSVCHPTGTPEKNKMFFARVKIPANCFVTAFVFDASKELFAKNAAVFWSTFRKTYIKCVLTLFKSRRQRKIGRDPSLICTCSNDRYNTSPSFTNLNDFWLTTAFGVFGAGHRGSTRVGTRHWCFGTEHRFCFFFFWWLLHSNGGSFLSNVPFLRVSFRFFKICSCCATAETRDHIRR